MREREIIVLENAEALAVRAAEEIAHIAGEAICENGEFTLCLSGGSTPASAYELLATRFELSVDWKEVKFFWIDERCVPPDDPGSNYGMASQTMFGKLGVKPAQIHRIRGEEEPHRAAQDYEREIREVFRISPGEFPRFDLVLLGLGSNGHVASLFPASRFIHERERIAVAVEVDDPHRQRVTLTPPALNNAARIMFLVSGETKADAVKQALQGARDPDRLPVHIIAPANGTTLWLLDKRAASRLSQG